MAETPNPVISLTESARAVFRELARTGPATRPQIGQSLGLSRPTMSAAMGELGDLGYVDVAGEVQGPLGRKALEYRVGGGAGHVIAVDAGSTHVQLRASTLDRRQLYSGATRMNPPQFALNAEISQAVADQMQQVLALSRPEWGPLRAVGIAVPARVTQTAAGRHATGQDLIFSRFSPPDGVEVVLENNVNCAAVAEQLYGAARDLPTFAYVQVGLKIGMGVILSGNLVRGLNGAAGEIGHLAFPWAPGKTPLAGEAERYLGSDALIERVRQGWPADRGDAPASVDALLALADAGDADALHHLGLHAADIGAVVASIVSIVDPGLVILGGGVGASPVLAPMVAQVTNRLSYPAEVRSTELGYDATILGIERLTIDSAVPRILGEV